MKILVDDKNVVIGWEVVGNSWKNNPYGIEVDDIPKEVRNADVGAFCYSEEKGFYENPDYIPPEDDSVDYDEVALDHEFRISMLELGI